MVALATLFLLTALALGAAKQMHNPYRVAITIVAALVVGVALLVEYSSSVSGE